MKKFTAIFFGALVVCFAFVNIKAQRKDSTELNKNSLRKDYKPIVLNDSPALKALLDGAVSDAVEKFSAKNLKPEFIAATLIDMRDADNFKRASVRGEAKFIRRASSKCFICRRFTGSWKTDE